MGLAQKPAKAWVSAEVTTTHRRTQPRPQNPFGESVWAESLWPCTYPRSDLLASGNNMREGAGNPQKGGCCCWRSKIELILLILL